MTKTLTKAPVLHLAKHLLLAAMSLIFSIFWIISPALAQNPLELVLNPNDSPNLPKTTLNYEIKPTKSVEDVLTVRNISKTVTYHFLVYPVDSVESNDGTGAYKLANQEQKLVGNWIKFNQADQTIAPGKTLYLPYQINIPETASPGTYKGGLVVQVTPNPEAASSKPAPTQQVQVIARLVEPIVIAIPGRQIANYNLDNFDYQQINGLPSFRLKFSNSGNMILQGDANVSVSGTLLPSPYQLSLNHTVILQGSSYEKTFQFENPPLFGGYTADLEFNVYQYDVNKDRFTLIRTIHKSIQFGIIPYACIFALLILIILAILAERWRRKYLKEASLNTFLHKVSKGETINSIAELYHLNWRTIARINKLHKPYSLSIGDELVLPFPESNKKPHSNKTANS